MKDTVKDTDPQRCSYAQRDEFGAWLACVNIASVRLVPTADAPVGTTLTASLPFRCWQHIGQHGPYWEVKREAVSP